MLWLLLVMFMSNNTGSGATKIEVMYYTLSSQEICEEQQRQLSKIFKETSVPYSLKCLPVLFENEKKN